MGNTYYLIKYEDNWADEMDIDGACVLTEGEYKAFTDVVVNFDNFDGYIDFVVGTNQSVEYYSRAEVEQAFTVREITEDEYKVLSELGLDDIGFARDFVREISY